jgi:hypothetical protein
LGLCFQHSRPALRTFFSIMCFCVRHPTFQLHKLLLLLQWPALLRPRMVDQRWSLLFPLDAWHVHLVLCQSPTVC